MTMPYCIQIGNSLSDQEKVKVESIILSVFSDVHHIFNNWNSQSEISHLNQLEAYEPCPVSPELLKFLECIDQIVDLTEGRFDPTIGLVQQVWKNHLHQKMVPSHDQIQDLLSTVGWKKIHLEKGFFWKEISQTAIDLGGIAKGYAVDLFIERLREAGYPNLFVEWGGEIRTLGHHPDKRAWRVGIYGLSEHIELKNEAIATSGSYLQNWTIHGQNYTHIIDPRTSLPLSNTPFSSITVIAPTCTEADAIATALMLFSSVEEITKWAENRGIKFYVW